MKNFTGIQDIHARTAGEFLDLLISRQKPWSDCPTEWIYRGQASADWSLIPKAHRNGWAPFDDLSIDLALPAGRKLTAPGWSERKQFMDEMLKAFRIELNQGGGTIPSEYAKDYWETPRMSSGAHPERDQWPQMALAQHHGLPTLLLDWSKRSLVASYFAASSSLDPLAPGLSDHIAVWGARRWQLGRMNTCPIRRPQMPEFYEAPAATNPNANAQAATFTIYTPEDDQPLENFYGAIWEDTKTHESYMYRVTLPRVESPKLLRLLAHEGVTGSSMFPGAERAVRAMRERKFWDKR